MDAVLLARAQFAFTVAFHFLFVPISLGSGMFLLLAARRWYKSRSETDQAGLAFWLKIFATTFAVGVASGITMEFAFGTNWATYSRVVGDIFGAPLAAEALFAFFLESVFLGILLFGRKRVSPRFYYVSTWLVVGGALLSALWIIIANSWQQTPAGYEMQGGKAVLTHFWAAAFNPTTIPRYLHTVVSTWVMGAFMAGGIAAYYLRKGLHTDFAKKTLKVAVIFGLICTIAMPIIGDWQARVVADHQPAKMAAFEGLFTTESNADLTLFGIVDADQQTTHAKLALPGILSLLLTGSTSGEVTGLDSIPADEQPPLEATYYTYRVMVILGIYFLLLLLVGVFLQLRKKLTTDRRYQAVLMWSAPFAMLAIQCGWFAAEIGRQPWVVQDILKTKDAVSSAVPAAQILTTLIIFAVIYALIFAVWFRTIRRTLKSGPVVGAAAGYGDDAPAPDTTANPVPPAGKEEVTS
jgi:cytochrome d ubiquinol oxidase subunit I